MKRLFCALLASLMLIAGCSCIRNNAVLSEIRTVPEDSPWWNDSVTTIAREDISSALNVDPYMMMSQYYTLDDSVILGFTAYEQTGLACLLQQYSFDGNMLGQIDLEEYFGTDTDYGFPSAVYEVGGIQYAVLNAYDPEEETYCDIRLRLDFQSGTVTERSIVEIPDAGDEYCQIDSMAGVGEKLVYLLSLHDGTETSYKICVDDGSQQTLWEPSFGNNVELDYLWEIMPEGNGISFIAPVTDNGIGKTLYCTLDTDTLAFQYYEVDNEVQYAQFVPGCGIFSCTDDAVIRFNAEEGGQEEILDLRNTYINNMYENNVNYRVVYADTDKVMMYVDVQAGSAGFETGHLIVLQKAQTNPNAGRKILSLAALDWLSVQEYRVIDEFNMRNDEYFIEVDNKYYDIVEEGWQIAALEDDPAARDRYTSDAVSQLMSDIREGTGPDLVIYGTDCAQLNDTDYLLDLTGRISGEESLNSGDYMDFVLQGNGRDGKHYRLDYSFSFYGLVVKTEFLDSTDMQGLTYEQYDRFISDSNRGMNVLYEGDLNMMKQLLRTGDVLTFDSEGKLTLDTEAFRQMAEYIASVPDTASFDNVIGGPAGNLTAVENGNYNAFLYTFGYVYDDYSIIGLPSFDGHAEAVIGRGIGITSCCPLADAAWDIAMTFMSPEVQSQGFGASSDPVLRSAQRTVYDAFFEQQASAGADPYSSRGPLPEGSVDHYIGQISDAVIVPDIDSSVLVIMNEEMPAFFEGQKTLEEVCGIIENRVNNMIAERG